MHSSVAAHYVETIDDARLDSMNDKSWDMHGLLSSYAIKGTAPSLSQA